MSADWEEVKQLALSFQQQQLCATVQRLSERNCIDIVKRLIEMKLIDVIFTNDGKSYLTSDQLAREIENELYAAGGRISTTDLVGILNVDNVHIEAKANYLVRNSGGEISGVLDQLISREYKDNLASEIDLHLQETGTVAISELSKQYNLPAEFIMNLLFERLDTLTKGKLDKDARLLYTYDYLARFESKIVGIFSAITRPVAIQTIVNRYSIVEKILATTLDQLLEKKRILGSISGPTFIPEIYSKSQQEYVSNFFKHNRYLDYSTLAKLGISNAKNYLEKKFANELVYLETCAVERLLVLQLESTIEECIQNNAFVDLVDIMPSVLSSTDIDLLIKKALDRNKSFTDVTNVLCDTIIASKNFVEKTKEYFNDIKKKRAEDDLKNGILLQYFSKSKTANKSDLSTGDEKRSKGETDLAPTGKGKGKKGSGGGSGNAAGREVKVKAVKKKYKSGKGDASRHEDEEAEKAPLIFLDTDEIIKLLTEKLAQEKDLEEISDLFIEALAEHIYEDLQRKYETFAKELFVFHSMKSGKSKKSFTDVQKFVNETFAQICLFEKGIQVFDSGLQNADLKSKLMKHLQRTLCTEIVNSIVSYFAEEDVSSNISNEARTKVIAKLDSEIKEGLTKVNIALNGSEVKDFLKEFEQYSSKFDIMIKRVDKKRERVLLSEHRQLLLMQLNECQDPILGLHISTLFLFQVIHDSMLHATGKFVPQILGALEKHIEADLFKVLKESQDLVLQFVSAKEAPLKDDLSTRISGLFNVYKTRIVEYKRPQPAQ